MPAPRKPPPSWWLLGYLAQYKPKFLLESLARAGLNSDEVYAAATRAALDLPAEDYRRASKSWAVRQHRARQNDNRSWSSDSTTT